MILLQNIVVDEKSVKNELKRSITFYARFMMIVYDECLEGKPMPSF